MCFYYDVYNEFSVDRVVTSRKTHKCDDCHGAINPGEKYHYYTGKCEGDFFAYKVCRRCDYERVRIAEHELAEGCMGSEIWCPIGGLLEHLNESDMQLTKREDVPASFQVGDKPNRPALEVTS